MIMSQTCYEPKRTFQTQMNDTLSKVLYKGSAT